MITRSIQRHGLSHLEETLRTTHEGENRIKSARQISRRLAELHQRFFNETLDYVVDDKAGAEALLGNVIAMFPREQLPSASLDEVAGHYVQDHFPHASAHRRAELVARIKQANEIRQGLYSI